MLSIISLIVIRNSVRLFVAVGFVYIYLENVFYAQTDGISMGSPLGPSISEFYISHIENKICNTIKKNTRLPCR